MVNKQELFIHLLTLLLKKKKSNQHNIRSRKYSVVRLTLHAHNSYTRILMGRTPLSILKFGSAQFSAQTQVPASGNGRGKDLYILALEPRQDAPPLSLSFFISTTAVTICN